MAQAQVAEVLKVVKRRDPNQSEFLQAVEELAGTLTPLFKKKPEYLTVLKTVCEPERVVQFRVPWIDDKGKFQVNRGFRVQFSQTLGPYKGGLRFHPSVQLSIIKFLGFEQIFKNALTGQPIGGGKGGSDFDPKGKSDGEVLRFCQSFMTELAKYIGPDTDVPAGDIGVGGREIGFLYGQWKRLTDSFSGVLTGKGPDWGGSLIRPEATGYGLLYITLNALEAMGDDLKGKKVCISGGGNVATFAAIKATQLGATVLSMSDSGGCIIDSKGFDMESLKKLQVLKTVQRKRISEWKSDTSKYYAGKQPWDFDNLKYEVCLPCATQNEINESQAKNCVKCGVQFIAEGANMPTTNEAIEVFKDKCTFFIPAKAANAGGVAVSALEMAQGSQRQAWTSEKVDEELKNIMATIFKNISETATEFGCKGDYQFGANAAGFKKVAEAMLDQGEAFVPESERVSS